MGIRGAALEKVVSSEALDIEKMLSAIDTYQTTITTNQEKFLESECQNNDMLAANDFDKSIEEIIDTTDKFPAPNRLSSIIKA